MEFDILNLKITSKGGSSLLSYRTLENTPVDVIHEAFVDAFSDYQVKMDLPLWRFQQMKKRRGFSGKLSMGAFDGERLVAFVLNGSRLWQGEKTVYDMGTGVIRDYRRQGITTKILTELEGLLKDEGIGQYLLEVLQENTSAFELYKKQGFEITRALNCYKLFKANVTFSESRYQIHRVKPRTMSPLESFWDFIPSWQNSSESVLAVADDFGYAEVVLEGQVAGYGLIDKKSGDVPQLAVRKDLRNQGIGSSILKDLLLQTEAPHAVFLNVESTKKETVSFLLGAGAESTVDQYEMLKRL